VAGATARLALKRAIRHMVNVTSVEITDEIKRLPRAEQVRVIDFVLGARVVRPLTPGELASQMVEAKDPADAERLQAEIVRGFYGGPATA
jgi:hypothetical protein